MPLDQALDQPIDQRQRPLRDLRISLTDRCNFRCSYCMPKEVFNSDYVYLPQRELLTFEEISRLARIFVKQGVQKIRLTGGEPLLRKNIESLIAMLAQIKTQQGQALDIALTTNGSLLKKKAASLFEVGLKRITVSLDALDDNVFKRMNDVDFSVNEVLDGIAAAQSSGFGESGAIKVNMVVKRGVNEDQILPMAKYFKALGCTLRFIEYMDVGSTNGWEMSEVVPSREVIQKIQAWHALTPLEANHLGETSQRWAYTSASGTHDSSTPEIGVISSVTQAFCSTCNRARLSPEGKLYLCLFAAQGHDLRALLRSDATEAAIQESIQSIWRSRNDHYSEQRASHKASKIIPIKRVEMSYIGG